MLLEGRVEGGPLIKVDVDDWCLEMPGLMDNGLGQGQGTQFMAAAIPYELCGGCSCQSLTYKSSQVKTYKSMALARRGHVEMHLQDLAR